MQQLQQPLNNKQITTIKYINSEKEEDEEAFIIDEAMDGWMDTWILGYFKVGYLNHYGDDDCSSLQFE